MVVDYASQRDEELMRAVARKETGALCEMVERYHGRLYAYVHRTLFGHHLSEDIVQECFIRLLDAAERYEYPRPFRPWFYTIARNLCRSLGRKASFRLDTSLDEQGDWAGPHRTEEQAMARVEQEEVELALQDLSREHREVVILRFYEDMKLSEIAEVLGLPAGTVKSRLFYAVKLLRKRMEAKKP